MARRSETLTRLSSDGVDAHDTAVAPVGFDPGIVLQPGEVAVPATREERLAEDRAQAEQVAARLARPVEADPGIVLEANEAWLPSGVHRVADRKSEWQMLNDLTVEVAELKAAVEALTGMLS